jgi:hypothetical protein
MNTIPALRLLVLLSIGTPALSAQVAMNNAPLGWATNLAGVYRLYVKGTQASPGPMVAFSTPSTNLPLEIRFALMAFRAAGNVTITTNYTRVFDHFTETSLNHLLWTNFIAHTNGRSMAMWSIRKRQPDWPASPAITRWNTNSLIWGMKGMTAICPCWSWEGPPGWGPITALSRRHGYTRGHGMGPDRIGKSYAGQKAWFLTTNNHVVETKVLREVVRTMDKSGRDYTILLFDTDLPETIETMRVIATANYFSTYPPCEGAPNLYFATEQEGNVSANVPGFTVNIMKGGDSGSPNMLPMPGELVFFSGRTTSGPSPEMQADMDELCRLENLDPGKYQLQWLDLSSFPRY